MRASLKHCTTYSYTARYRNYQHNNIIMMDSHTSMHVHVVDTDAGIDNTTIK